jgi:acylphosphatase
MAIVHRNITISGIVQGVGFRYHAVITAQSLNIKGFVENLPGGEVYIAAEGELEKVESFINWCYIGPPQARVNDVLITSDNVADYKTFNVKY